MNKYGSQKTTIYGTGEFGVLFIGFISVNNGSKSWYWYRHMVFGINTVNIGCQYQLFQQYLP